jgi:carboxypeptidase Taq
VDEDLDNKLANIRKTDEIAGYLTSLYHLLMWDLWTCLPSEGIDYRERLAGFIAGEQYKNYCTKEIHEIVYYLENADNIKDVDKAIVRELKRNYELNVRVPYEKKMKLDEVCTKAQAAWKEAYEKSDFQIFRPYLEQIVNLNKEVADCIGYEGSRLNALIYRLEPGLDVERIEKLFTCLKVGIFDLLGKIEKSQIQIEPTLVNKNYSKQNLYRLSKYIVEKVGYNIEAGGYGESLHPFTSFIGPRDVRFTINYNNFESSVLSALHEAGHAIYSQNGDDRLKYTGLWGGIMGFIHESQGRFFENILGRSKEFWLYFYPYVQKELEEFKSMEFEEFYKAINRVVPSFIRTDADELTYNIHAIIRFEIEKDLFDDKIKIGDLPEVWNTKYKEYLGIEPASYREGILQDMHWSMGLFGYFQSYALGNIFGGQFFHRMKKDKPNILHHVQNGDFKEVIYWLTENIYRYSKVYTPSELIIKSTGEELSSKYLLEYFNQKYSEIYCL